MATFSLKTSDTDAGIRFRKAVKASGTVIAAGRLVALSSGLIVDAGAADTAVAWCEKGAAAGTTEIEVSVGNDFTLKGTADAVFAATNRGTEVDIDANQQIDLGESSTDILKVGIFDNSGTVGSTADVEVRINKPLF